VSVPVTVDRYKGSRNAERSPPCTPREGKEKESEGAEKRMEKTEEKREDYKK
jgi:hypothetical protein